MMMMVMMLDDTYYDKDDDDDDLYEMGKYLVLELRIPVFRFDLNNDGEISQTEMDNILEDLRKKENKDDEIKMKDFFGFMVRNGDGNITREQFMNGVESWMHQKYTKMLK